MSHDTFGAHIAYRGITFRRSCIPFRQRVVSPAVLPFPDLQSILTQPLRHRCSPWFTAPPIFLRSGSRALVTGSEVHGVHLAPIACTGAAHTDPDLGKALAEDVRPVVRAVHPLFEAALRRTQGSRAPTDVLAYCPVRVAGGGVAEALDPIFHGPTVIGLVPEIVLVEHPLGVGPGGLRTSGIHAERGEPPVSAGLVVEVEGALFVAAELDGFAGAGLHGEERTRSRLLRRGQSPYGEDEHERRRRKHYRCVLGSHVGSPLCTNRDISANRRSSGSSNRSCDYYACEGPKMSFARPPISPNHNIWYSRCGCSSKRCT